MRRLSRRHQSRAVRRYGGKAIEITRESCLPANRVVAFFSNPFSNLDASRQAQLRIDNALISPVHTHNGWMVAITLFVFMAFFAMVRRMRMAGAVGIDADPHSLERHEYRVVDKPGGVDRHRAHSCPPSESMATPQCFSPSRRVPSFTSSRPLSSSETKGKTLEEIEAHFEGAKKNPGLATA